MDEKRKPWGDAYAIKPGRETPDGRTGEMLEGKEIWINLGPVWESAQGNFSFVLDVEPLHWRNPNTERRVVITKRKAQPASSSGSTSSRRGRA